VVSTEPLPPLEASQKIGRMVFTIITRVYDSDGSSSVRGRRDDNSVCSMGGDRSSVRGSGLHVRVRIRMLMPGCLKLKDLRQKVIPLLR